ncbi:hypothetical protein ABFS83_13G169200 [Erythranthe nasuta]
MVQTLEAIRGGGGSVKIGTTGTISALMTREIEYSASKVPPLCTPAPTNDVTPRKPKPRTSSDEASSSSTTTTASTVKNEAKKTKHQSVRTHQIPMLAADNISLDGTPVRQKPVKKGPAGVVEIVDIKCGSSDKNWVNPIANRLKKLGFSKLSSDNVN